MVAHGRPKRRDASGQGEGDDGDRGARRGAEREGGANRALQSHPEGDPGGPRRRGLSQGRRELHTAPAQGVPGRGGLGADREAHRLRPGRGAHRGGAG